MADGKAAIKDETVKLKTAGGDEWKKTGIQFNMNLIGMSPLTVNPADNSPLNLFETGNVYKTSLNPVQKDYCEHYGVSYPAEAFKKMLDEGKTKIRKI
jgi:hypothetical protein